MENIYTVLRNLSKRSRLKLLPYRATTAVYCTSETKCSKLYTHVMGAVIAALI